MSATVSFKNRTKQVSVFRAAKDELDIFLEENPNIKLVYFISDAIIEKLGKEKLRKQLTEMGRSSNELIGNLERR